MISNKKNFQAERRRIKEELKNESRSEKHRHAVRAYRESQNAEDRLTIQMKKSLRNTSIGFFCGSMMGAITFAYLFNFNDGLSQLSAFGALLGLTAAGAMIGGASNRKNYEHAEEERDLAELEYELTKDYLAF